MFLSSRNNQFRFEFPRKFIPDEIADKYRAFINRIPGGMIKEPIDIFNYGIQSINLPGPSFDTVTQNDYPGFTRNFRDAKPTQELFDKTLTVTMQSFDGFINYWMAVEMMQYYYSRDGKQPWIPEGVGLQLMDGEGNLFMTAQLKEMIMTGVGALDLNFSSNTVDFQTFDINFVYNILEIKSIATERVRAIPVSTSTAPVCLPAKILLNGSDALDALSGVRTDIKVLQGGEPVGKWNGRELIIPPCEDAQWELIDTGGGTLSTGSILGGGSAIIVAPDAGYTLEDSLGQILDSGLVTSGGSITLAAPNGVWVLEDTFGGVLGTGAILSGGSETITAPDASVERDGLPFSIVAAGGSINVPSDSYQVLSDTVGNVNYIGTSPIGTSTAAGIWTINRITVATDGSVTVETAMGSWDDRLTLPYT